MQRRFLEYAKLRSGLIWREFDKSLCISNHVNYRYKVCSLPLQVFRKTLRVARMSQSEAEKFNYRMVEQPSEMVLRLNRNASLAELVGICLGDGHLTPRTLAVFGSKSEDTEYLTHRVLPVMRDVLGRTPKLNTNRPDENFLVVNSTAASKALHRLGLPYGDKIANHARIPAWVFKRRSFLVACLRGLFDTDGSVYGFRRIPLARGSKAIVSFEFGKGSLLAKNVFRALRRLGFSPRMMPHRNECRLGFNADIVRFMSEIKPLNAKHRQNFLRWHGPVV